MLICSGRLGEPSLPTGWQADRLTRRYAEDGLESRPYRQADKPTRRYADMTFHSKVDRWLRVVLFGAAIPPLVAVVAIAVTDSLLHGLMVSPMLLLAVGLPIWLLRTTTYTFDADILLVRSGPFSWRVPIRDIRRVTPTRNPLSSPAFSLDRLRIEYGNRALMISPDDKEGFLEELRRRMQAQAE